jgi:hypothetical protein
MASKISNFILSVQGDRLIWPAIFSACGERIPLLIKYSVVNFMSEIQHGRTLGWKSVDRHRGFTGYW